MKKILLLLLVIVIPLTVITNPVLAGSKQSHRWEGVAIGIGAVLLGSAIYHSHKIPVYHKHRSAPVKRHYRLHPGPRYRTGKHFNRGRWHIVREWIPPVYEKAWNPGHYNRHGVWVEGQWIMIEIEPGYHVEKRVWLSRR